MVRLPLALQAFQTLQRFPPMRPRRLAVVPIGGPSLPEGEGTIPSHHLQQSALHLYHDLGVLVFAGCSVSQVRTIGDVLAQTVAWGGQGGLVALLDVWEEKGVRRREDRSLVDVFEGLDEKRIGILKPESLLKLATNRFRESFKERIPDLTGPNAKDIHIRETQVVFPGSPPPRGITNETAYGRSTLPIESFSSLTVDRLTGFTTGEARFFAVGTGNYVGAARIDYQMLKRNDIPGHKEFKSFWGHGKLRQKRKASDATQLGIVNQVLEKVMKPLWNLERHVWAGRAEALWKSRQRKKEKDERGG